MDKERVQDTDRELRAALVFYGGVSLAVYENGVARAFYDASRRRGIFGPLMTLLKGRLVVDVVSGSSAGGINGLMLAAALESGAEFKPTADLWREAGGIDKLFRDPATSDSASSLLKGETYYLDQLRAAFRSLCVLNKVEEAPEDAPKEIDVFITGTDLSGQKDTFTDAAMNPIETMDHRLVFHLKRRRDRRILGRDALPEETLEEMGDKAKFLQADILASVARITSSFPGAFPPFTTGELATKRADAATDTPNLVRQALERLGGVPLKDWLNEEDPEMRDHALVDGGVLDNKPFGPVLKAIFHRMPSVNGEAVERKLFFIEPDPETFKRKADFSPLEVILKSVVSMPMYDSIAADVRQIEAHNSKVRRFRALRQKAQEAHSRDPGACTTGSAQFAYRAALCQSIGCMLLGVDPSEVDAALGLHAIHDILEEQLPADGSSPKPTERDSGAALSTEQWLDVGFHLRRAFDLLYHETRDCARAARIGRVVKALKLLRDIWLSSISKFHRAHPDHPLGAESMKRRQLGAPAPQDLAEAVTHRLALLHRYLDAQWHKEKGPLQADVEELASAKLTALKNEASGWLWKELESGADARSDPGLGGDAPPAALSWLGAVLMNNLEERKRCRFESFASVDACVYPAELAAGLYELDIIDIARIAPKDADFPTQEAISGAARITGDRLGHFSAFLRRDWRTNDIAWGHSDAMCLIIKVLLSERAWEGIAERLSAGDNAALSETFKAERLMACLGAGREKAIQTAEEETHRSLLQEQCDKVEQAFKALREQPADVVRQETFRAALTEAGQLAAMREYTMTIAEDAQIQHQEWRWKEGPERRLDPGISAMAQMIDLRLGDKSFAEEIPSSLVVEYVSKIGLLLLGMIDASAPTKGWGRRLFDKIRSKIAPLLGFTHFIGQRLRSERPLAMALLLSLFVGLVAFGVGGAVAGSGLTAVIGFGLAFVLSIIISWWSTPGKAILLGLLAAGVASLTWTEFGRGLLASVGGILVTAGKWLGGGGPGAL